MDFVIARGVKNTSWEQITQLEAYTDIEYQMVETTSGSGRYKIASVKMVPVPVTKFRPVSKLIDKETVENQGIGSLARFNSLDVEIGISGIASNDFELKIARNDSIFYGLNFGAFIFSSDTEFGGMLEQIDVDTSTDELIWTGITWRGMLDKDIIDPGTDDYKIVSGEANEIIADILSDGCGSFFTVSDTNTGVTFTDYQFDRYTSKLKGLTKMLATEGYKLKIWAEDGCPNGVMKVYAEAVPINDYSEEIRYGTDNDVDLTLTDYRGGINHLICLGDGELSARRRIDIYVTDEDGNRYSGAQERSAIYDCSSVEGDTDSEKAANLLSAGKEQLKTLANSQSMGMTIDDTPADIGDIINGLDRTTGLSLSKPLTKMILRKTYNTETIEHGLEEAETSTEEEIA
jgi:hypothetical protein